MQKTSLFPLVIYPSQLKTFQERADKFASIISRRASAKMLSSFKRYDYLSMALGYKSYSDLINASKFRADGDEHKDLILFSDDSIRGSIYGVFSSRLVNVDASHIYSACFEMIDFELAKTERKFILMDECSFLLSGKPCGTNFMSHIGNELTPKNDLPVLKIDLSEVPDIICELLIQHSKMKEIFLCANRSDINYSLVLRADKAVAPKKDWRIRASLDVWGAPGIPVDLIGKWSSFIDWLLLFNPTGRVHLSERISGHSFSLVQTQTFDAPNATLDVLMDRLPSIDDKMIYALLV